MYVSPLKALGVDVDNNLRAPLKGIALAAEKLGVDVASVLLGRNLCGLAVDVRRLGRLVGGGSGVGLGGRRRCGGDSGGGGFVKTGSCVCPAALGLLGGYVGARRVSNRVARDAA